MSRRRAHGDTASPGVLACGRRSCMTEAAPDSLYCPQHAREIVLGLEECRVSGCDERVPFGSLHCAEHAELRRLGRLSVTGEAVPAHLWPKDVPPAVEPVTSIRLVPPPEEKPRGGAHAVPPLPTAEGRPFDVVPRTPTCRKCDQPVREGGARAGRYGNLCVAHYDEQRALTSEACKRGTPGRRIGGSEPRREEPVPEPTPVAPPAEDPTPDAPVLDAPLPEIGAALRREGEQARAQELPMGAGSALQPEVIGGVRMTGVPSQEELDAEPACTHEQQQVNGAGLITCCACGLCVGHEPDEDALNGRPGDPRPREPQRWPRPEEIPEPLRPRMETHPDHAEGCMLIIDHDGDCVTAESGTTRHLRPRALRPGPIGGAYERMIDAQLVTSVEVFPEPSPAERVLEAYAVAIQDALAAWGAELTLHESSIPLEDLALHAERLLKLCPGIRIAVELLTEAEEREAAGA